MTKQAVNIGRRSGNVQSQIYILRLVDRQKLFLMAFPEAKPNVSNGIAARLNKTPAEAWRKFSNDRSLLHRYRVSSRKLRALKHLTRLGYVPSPRVFAAIVILLRPDHE